MKFQMHQRVLVKFGHDWKSGVVTEVQPNSIAVYCGVEGYIYIHESVYARDVRRD